MSKLKLSWGQGLIEIPQMKPVKQESNAILRGLWKRGRRSMTGHELAFSAAPIALSQKFLCLRLHWWEEYVSSGDENEGCKNSMIDSEKNLSIRDCGTTSRIAIFRDREKDRTDPDYDRSYERFAKNIPTNQTFSLAPFNMQKISASICAVWYRCSSVGSDAKNPSFPELQHPNHEPFLCHRIQSDI